MTDAAIENAAAIRNDMAVKIAAAEVQIKEWRVKMARAERFIADWEEFSGQQAPGPAVSSVAEPTSDVRQSRRPKNPKKEEVAALAREILLQNGRPMTRDDLHQAILDRGVVIHGGNPAVVLQTMLWRMSSEITHIKGFGYWPKDMPSTVAGYSPAALAEIAADLASSLDDLLK